MHHSSEEAECRSLRYRKCPRDVRQARCSHQLRACTPRDTRCKTRAQFWGPVAGRVPPALFGTTDSLSSVCSQLHSCPLAMKAAVAVLVSLLTGPSNAYGFLVCPQVAHRSSRRGSNQPGRRVHVPRRAIADDQDLPPIVEKRRPAERTSISILSVRLWSSYAHCPVM